MSATQRSNDRAGALTLILLCLYWIWVSAWQPGTFGLSSAVEGITGRAVVSAGVSSALQGTSFQQGLVSSVVADTAAIGANAIGSTYGPTGTDPNAGLQTLAHGALGCAQGALTGGNCASGAAGAAAESVLGHVVDAAGGLPADGSGHNTTAGAAAYATGAAIGGAVAGQAAGGNAQSGANTAINAAANNYLTHNQIAQKQQDLSQAVSQEQKKQINSQYAALDAQQQQNAGTQQLGTLLGVQQGLGTPIQGCGVPTNCAANVQQSQQEINSAIVLNGGATLPDNTTTGAIISLFGGGPVFGGLNALSNPIGEKGGVEAAQGELAFGANGRKLDFLFNRNIDQSNAYNALRAEGNASRIGISDTPANRAEVTRLFNESYNNSATIVGPGELPGSNVREFFLPGVSGTGSKIQFVERNGNVITIIAK